MFNPQIHVRFLRHRHLYLGYMSFFHILKSASKYMAVYHFLQSTSLTYALTLILTLTNKSAIGLRIWKWHRFDNTFKSDRDMWYWCQWILICGVDADLSPNADLSLSHVNVFQVTIRLKPGHLLAMINRKVLHGRQEFQSNGGVRFLQVRIVHFSVSLIVN